MGIIFTKPIPRTDWWLRVSRARGRVGWSVQVYRKSPQCGYQLMLRSWGKRQKPKWTEVKGE